MAEQPGVLANIKHAATSSPYWKTLAYTSRSIDAPAAYLERTGQPARWQVSAQQLFPATSLLRFRFSVLLKRRWQSRNIACAGRHGDARILKRVAERFGAPT